MADQLSTLLETLGVVRKRIQQIKVRKEMVGDLRQRSLNRGI
jgi:hypothetical protein